MFSQGKGCIEVAGDEDLAEHLSQCRAVDAAIVVQGSADEVVSRLLAEGWTYEGVEYLGDKRVRYLVPPSDRV